MRIRPFFLALAVTLLAPLQSSATAIAASFSLPQTPFGGLLADGVDGFAFAPTQAIRVTDLGWYDHGGDGLLHTHPVGIFDAANQGLLASVTVSNNSALDGASNFRFEALAAGLDLLAGHTYVVAGLGIGPDFDPYVFAPVGGVTYGAEVGFMVYRFEFSNALVYPTVNGGANPFFGANFRYETSTVPEPASYGLAGLALILGTLLRRRRI